MYLVCKTYSFSKSLLEKVAAGTRKGDPQLFKERLNISRLRRMELCFVQFFEVLDKDYLSIDQVDSALDCIQPQWQQSKDAGWRTKTGNVYGLVPVDSLREMVHIIGSDEFIEKLSRSTLCQKEISNLAGPERGGTSHIFYVNHYFVYRSDIYDYTEVV